MLAVAGLALTQSLPAMAQDLAEDGLQPGIRTPAVNPVQRLSVDADVATPRAGLDDIRAQGAPTPTWSAPLTGDLRDPFGPRLERPVAGVNSFHRGQDIGADCGRDVRAAAGGTVVRAGWYGTYGYWVLIDHGDGLQTGYAHMQSVLVSAGQRIGDGRLVGRVGSTGASSGCHLHFETRVGGVAVNPVSFLAARGVTLR